MRRLNDDGLAVIDLLELLVKKCIKAETQITKAKVDEDDPLAKVKVDEARQMVWVRAAKAIEQYFRLALQADRSESDTEMVRLRRDIEKKRTAEDDVDRGMH